MFNDYSYFDPRIREVILPTNLDGVVLNERFLPWEDRVRKVLDIPNVDANVRIARATHERIVESLFYKYHYDPDKTLFENCKKHADEFETPIIADDVVILVHPMYMHLCNMQRVHQHNAEEDADRYLDRIKRFFSTLEETKKRRESLSVVLFETAHHYAAATSRLVELGLVDKVVFTEFGVGNPKDPKELDSINDKTIYIAGGYNNLCLLGAIYDTLRRIKDPKKLFALRDLILNPPHYSNLLDPKWIGITKKTSLPLD